MVSILKPVVAISLVIISSLLILSGNELVAQQGQRVNAIMGIYDRQTGSLIKLSSFPNGFILNNTKGIIQLASTLTDPKIQNISTIVILTNADKSEKYTNDVSADLDLRTILPTTLPPLLSEIPASQSEGNVGQESGN
jgi:hypothetical protein